MNKVFFVKVEMRETEATRAWQILAHVILKLA